MASQASARQRVGAVRHEETDGLIQLLARFVLDDRIRIRNPRRDLQIKFSRPIGNNNEFIANI